MMTKKLFLIIFLGALLYPPVTLAIANTYETSGGDTICYEGLVPCGKEVRLNGSVSGGMCVGGSIISSPCSFCHFFILINGIWSWILTFLVAPIATLLFAIGGLMLVFAAGNPQQIANGKRIITAAVVGLVVIFGAFIIVGTIFSALGVADTNLGFVDLGQWFQIDCPI